MCKLRWNLVVGGPRVLTTMVPSCSGLHALYHGVSYPKYSRSVPWVLVPLSTQVDFDRNLKSTTVAVVPWV
jgi:hypothetical protein